MIRSTLASLPGQLESWVDPRLPESRPHIVWIRRGLLLALLCALYAWTWGVWPDLVVDCGREMYVPAELAAGRRLYHDVWYPYGPLAPVLNSWLFRLFGVHLNVLYVAGFASTSATVLLLHAIASRFVASGAAFTVAAGYSLQLFQPYLFNGIVPYSYGATYGSLLTLCCTLLLIRYLGSEPGPNLPLAAGAAALALLAKHEFGLACFFVFCLTACAKAWGARSRALLLPPFLWGASALLATLAVFAVYIQPSSFGHFIETNWMSFPGTHFMRVYGKYWIQAVGLRIEPVETLLLVSSTAIVLAAWAAAAFWLRRWAQWTFLIPAVAVLYTLLANKSDPYSGVLLLAHQFFYPRGMFYPALLMCALAAWAVWKRGPSRLISFAPLAWMAVAAGFRVLSRFKWSGYSVYYSPLVFLCFFVLLERAMLLPLPGRQLRRRMLFGSLIFTYGLGLAIFAWKDRYSTLEHFVYPVRTIRGEVRTTASRADFTNQVIRLIQSAKAQGQSVLLLPEFTGAYFLASASAPNRFFVLTPGVLSPGAVTSDYLRDLERNPPALIVLTNRPSHEYGVPYFGIDYDQEVLAWIERHYFVAGHIGRFVRNPKAPPAALLYRPRP
ncbi:MAG: hypothetical protein HY858_10505 [Candidatus Solibacter usitatus]|nr:hypothetical protein [Candidatus Solibacter usitatus]